MAVAWYGVKAWKATKPDGTNYAVTKPTHQFKWEMWTITKDDGSTVQVPQNVRPKYRGIASSISLAYNNVYDGINDATLPTVALARVEYPDGNPLPLEAADYEILLNTEAKWNNAMTQYPELRYRFSDQPYYPAV